MNVKEDDHISLNQLVIVNTSRYAVMIRFYHPRALSITEL